MHDGQNVFAHPESARFETWCANWTMDRLVAEGRIEPWIIVGIDHSEDRFGEYSPWDEPRVSSIGRGEGYAEYVVRHVMPFIDGIYRTRPESMWTAVAGASLGGLISLYLGRRYPQVFGRIGGFSPSVMWANGAMFGYWQAHTHRWSRVYIDAGANETVDWDRLHIDYGADVRAFWRHLCSMGYAPHELRLVLEPNGIHHERDWARRLPEALAWMLA